MGDQRRNVCSRENDIAMSPSSKLIQFRGSKFSEFTKIINHHLVRIDGGNVLWWRIFETGEGDWSDSNI